VEVRSWFAAAAALCIAGCGAEGPPVPLTPAHSRVLLGGEPAAGVEVRLVDAARVADVDAPRPFATTDAEGRFSLGTFEAEDGAPAGRYKVMLLWPEGPPGPGVPRDRLGNAYTNPAASPLELTVSEGVEDLAPLVIDPAVAKKAARRKAAPGPSANPAEGAASGR